MNKLKKLAEKKTSSQWMELEAYKKENRVWMDKSMDIALRILEILEEKNMSQNDLAVAVEVSRQQISKILKGQENLTLRTISRIEEVLNVALIELVSPESQRKADKVKPIVSSQVTKVKNAAEPLRNPGRGITTATVEKRNIVYNRRQYVSRLSDLVG